MPMEALLAGVRVRELAVAVDWYSRLFDRAPDIVPYDYEVMWRIADGGLFYVLQNPDRPGNGLVTISVTELDTMVADLASRSITVGPVEPMGDAVRRAAAKDPDGNTVALIEQAR
jgi:glyoxylase I family protein